MKQISVFDKEAPTVAKVIVAAVVLAMAMKFCEKVGFKWGKNG